MKSSKGYSGKYAAGSLMKKGAEKRLAKAKPPKKSKTCK